VLFGGARRKKRRRGHDRAILKEQWARSRLGSTRRSGESGTLRKGLLGVGHGAVASCGTLRVARGAVAGVAHGAQNKRTSAVYCGSRRSGIGGTRRRGLAWGTAPWLGWYTAPYLGWHTPPKIKMTHVAYSWYTAQWLRVAHGAIATAEHGDGAKRGAIGHGRPPSDSHKSSGPGRSRSLPYWVSAVHGAMWEVAHGAVTRVGWCTAGLSYKSSGPDRLSAR
jgi:hypothetical protein